MAITFVGSYVGTHAATSAQTVNFSNLRDASNAQPTLQQDDIVFVAVENASTVSRGGAALTPSGYTAWSTFNYQNDSNDSNFLVSRKVMGATPDTSVAIPASNATTAGVAYAIYVFRGVDTVDSSDVGEVVTGGTNTGIANGAAITPVTSGAWIVVFAGAAVAAGAVFTNPAGMSTTTNHFRSATITSTTNDANIGVAIYTGWTSGSYDPAAFGGSTSTNTGSWSAVTLALRPAAGPAAQNLTPSLFTNTQTFHAATVSSVVGLTPGLFTNSQTFYAPEVTQPGAAQSLTPALFTNDQAFFAPTSTSTYELTPGLYTSGQTFFAATVAPGSITLAPALVTNDQTFYSPTVSQGAQVLSPALFENSNSFFAPTVSPSVTIAPTLLTNSQTFHAPTVTAGYTLAPALVTNDQTFFAATVSTVTSLAPSLVTNAQTFYGATVTNGVPIAPALFTNTQTFPSPTVAAGAVTLAPSLVTNGQTFYAPTVSLGAGAQELQPALFTNAQTFPAPTVAYLADAVQNLHGRRPRIRRRPLVFPDDLPPIAPEAIAPVEVIEPLPSLETARAALEVAKAGLEAARIARAEAIEREAKAKALAALNSQFEAAQALYAAAMETERAIIERLWADDEFMLLAA